MKQCTYLHQLSRTPNQCKYVYKVHFKSNHGIRIDVEKRGGDMEEGAKMI